MAKFAWKYKRRYFRAEQRRTYTILGLSLLSLIIFGIFAIRPTVTTIIKLRRKIKDQEDVCEKLDQKLKNLSLAQTALKKIGSDIPTIEKAIPQGESFPDLLETLHLTSEKNGLRLEHIRFGQILAVPQKTTNQSLIVKVIPFNIRTEGGFSQSLDFLKSTQDTRRLFNAKGIRITSQRKGATETFELEAETYFYTNE